MLMRFEVETLPAGTRFETFLRLDRATPLEISFFTDVWGRFARDGFLGGRSAIGHGRVRANRIGWCWPARTHRQWTGASSSHHCVMRSSKRCAG